MSSISSQVPESSMAKRLPVIFILGATGTGKSKLAIELARRFKGEVINADSMQVYKGLDIITNKITKEEEMLATHHLFNFLSPWQRFTVVDFRNKALPIIDDLLNRNILPIIVGGTHYYLESVLWKTLVTPMADSNEPLLAEKNTFISSEVSDSVLSTTQNDQAQPHSQNHEALDHRLDPAVPSFTSIFQPNLKDIPTDILYNHLCKIDPSAANRIHPNDRRRAIRFLEVYEQTGRLYSDHLQEQMSQEGGSVLGGSLRIPNACLLWLQTDKIVLQERLDNRIEEMINRGLINELLDFHQQFNKERVNDSTHPKYTEGIFQSIGFKEFHDYLVMNESDHYSPAGEKLFKQSVEALKIRTRQYAKRQLKWINNRFLRCADRQVPPVYGLNSSSLLDWDAVVKAAAFDIVEAFIQGESPQQEPLPKGPFLSFKKEIFKCEVCHQSFMAEHQWSAHVQSKRHKSAVSRSAAQKKDDRPSS